MKANMGVCVQRSIGEGELGGRGRGGGRWGDVGGSGCGQEDPLGRGRGTVGHGVVFNHLCQLVLLTWFNMFKSELDLGIAGWSC